MILGILSVLTYLIGSIPTGVILSRVFGRGDLQQQGSRNIGATNVSRVMGKKWGIITLIGDVFKGTAAVWLGQWGLNSTPGTPDFALSLVALAAFLGHLFPVYLGFKGGKGVATALGIFLVFSPLVAFLAVPIFIGVVLVGKYVSLGSMLSAASFPMLLFILHYPAPVVWLAVVIAAFIIGKHHENIRRLLRGQEKPWNKKNQL
ncbi:MAG: glycerol-3-phosphate 1-O-acyltransferase PlsY [Deltaproteobacteria bacterium]|nr:glycerol-3-phosphate 1-O-acyltransferase PlsY [Deltaproteobacteria bacterium]